MCQFTSQTDERERAPHKVIDTQIIASFIYANTHAESHIGATTSTNESVMLLNLFGSAETLSQETYMRLTDHTHSDNLAVNSLELAHRREYKN